MKHYFVLALALCGFSCSQSSSGGSSGSVTIPSLTPSPSPTNCYLDQTVTYVLATSTSSNFIKQNVSVSGTVTATDCQGISVGATSSGTLKYMTRNGSTITLATVSNYSQFNYQLMDLTLNGSSVTPITLTSCYQGNSYTDIISGGSLNTTSNRLTLNIHSTATSSGCSSTPPSQYYEHTELKGMWEAACSVKEQKFVNFYRNSAIYTTRVYNNSGCSGLAMYIEENGPYNIRSTVAGGKQLDIGFKNFFVYLYTNAMASAFNSAAMCGKTNWTSGVDIDVSGLYCDFASLGLTTSQTFPTSRPYYELYTKSGSTVYLGNPATGDGTTNATRPTSVLTTSPYTLNTGSIAIPNWAH